MIDDDKPSLEELRHFGVLGMKWGKNRVKASSDEIRVARANVFKQQTMLESHAKKVLRTTKGNTPERAAGKEKLAEMRMDFLKNPDRVIAARLTRGEKAVTAMFALTGVGVVVPVAAIAGTSAHSRRIERKQDLGKFDKK
jgi:hypothetical protein